ncbi:hypothetical protein [Actinoallomurus iriomotensis]|uniref:DesT tetracyclin repressor-like C-terminal domain-containing protein n=1 Tax=Actinoallomurus iriomotensis TaxID=478107 RepID=A0A9W6VQD4_9ACTN|nr:hypothetical protein [Actinoallomurus iriomotensis]GLY80978.1 hypothetical protein Airi01_092450 [Actinoallomurus iriomotensis]
MRERVSASIDGRLELLDRHSEAWLAALEMTGSGGDPQLARVLDDARERAVDRINEVVGMTTLAAEHPEVNAVLRGYSGMAESISREWLRRGRLTRRQAYLLLEEALLHIISTALPQVIANQDEKAPNPGR